MVLLDWILQPPQKGSECLVHLFADMTVPVFGEGAAHLLKNRRIKKRKHLDKPFSIRLI